MEDGVSNWELRPGDVLRLKNPWMERDRNTVSPVISSGDIVMLLAIYDVEPVQHFVHAIVMDRYLHIHNVPPWWLGANAVKVIAT